MREYAPRCSPKAFLHDTATFSLSAALGTILGRQPTTLPRVLIVANGGTIAATGASPTDLSTIAVPPYSVSRS